MLAVRFFSGVLLAACLGPAHAQSLQSGVAPELLRYLQLSPAQGAAVNQLVSDWKTTVQNEATAADQIRSQIATETAKDQPDAVTLGGYYLQLQSLCRQATAARSDLVQNTRGVLTKDQLMRLQALDDALQLMPRVIEAQRTGLLPDSIETAPIGLPAGQITVPLKFPATTPAPLPGCLLSSQAQPGTIPVVGPALRR